MIAALLLAAAGPTFTVAACRELRARFHDREISCERRTSEAVVAEVYGNSRPYFVALYRKRATKSVGIVLAAQHSSGWTFGELAWWDQASVPVRLEVRPKGFYERAPPYTRARAPFEVDEIDTFGEVVVATLQDGRRWLLAPGQHTWLAVYLGFEEVQR